MRMLLALAMLIVAAAGVLVFTAPGRVYARVRRAGTGLHGGTVAQHGRIPRAAMHMRQLFVAVANARAVRPALRPPSAAASAYHRARPSSSPIGLCFRHGLDAAAVPSLRRSAGRSGVRLYSCRDHRLALVDPRLDHPRPPPSQPVSDPADRTRRRRDDVRCRARCRSRRRPRSWCRRPSRTVFASSPTSPTAGS